jgi:hypothetical protein
MVLNWEDVFCHGLPDTMSSLRRAAVPGGWLVLFATYEGPGGLTFYPDPNHEWKL